MLNYDDIFTDSFHRVLGTGAYNSAFISDFYAIFLDASPSVAEMFAHTDMSAQRTMLHDSLIMMIEFYKTKVPSPRLQQLAELHSRRQHDVPPEFYDLWLDSLVAAVSNQDPQFNDEVELAWRLALAPGICFMRFSY